MSEMKADCKEFDSLDNAIDYSKSLLKEGYSVAISPRCNDSIITQETRIIAFYVCSSNNKYRDIVVTEKTEKHYV